MGMGSESSFRRAGHESPVHDKDMRECVVHSAQSSVGVAAACLDFGAAIRPRTIVENYKSGIIKSFRSKPG